MIGAVLSIIGGILLLFFEMFMISAGLVSVGAVAAIELYQRVKWWQFLTVFLIISLGIDAYFNYFLGTYFISIALLVLFHSSMKRILPYERTPIRLSVLLLSFMIFHVSRNVLITIQVGRLENIELVSVLLSSFIRSVVETGMVIGATYLIKTYVGKDITSVKVKI